MKRKWHFTSLLNYVARQEQSRQILDFLFLVLVIRTLRI